MIFKRTQVLTILMISMDVGFGSHQLWITHGFNILTILILIRIRRCLKLFKSLLGDGLVTVFIRMKRGLKFTLIMLPQQLVI